MSWNDMDQGKVSILKQLNIQSRLFTICVKRIFEIFGHIARKSSDNLEKFMVTGKISGKRSRGRYPMRWSDQIDNTLDTAVPQSTMPYTPPRTEEDGQTSFREA